MDDALKNTFSLGAFFIYLGRYKEVSLGKLVKRTEEITYRGSIVHKFLCKIGTGAKVSMTRFDRTFIISPAMAEKLFPEEYERIQRRY